MENKKEQSTASSLLRFAGPYKGKYILSIFLSVLSVASSLVPYYAAAQMLIGLIGDERGVFLLSDVGCGCRHRVHSKILFLDPFHQRFTYCYLSCAPGCAETDC